jgi:aryl-alcohol dehydrogenase-like predicted oxidoreductase
MACDKFDDQLFRIARVRNSRDEEIGMRIVRLGRNGPDVSEMGLGCMGMSGGYGPADDAESIATIHAALEAGITMLDTGDFYGSGHNEMLIREALKSGKRERAFVAVKFGAMRGPDLCSEASCHSSG